MARDYENIHDIESLDDGDLHELVRERLREHNMLDIDDLEVRVVDGVVHLGGRVGTEGERRVAEHVVTDSLGLVNVHNEILVDPIRRSEAPAAIDDTRAVEDREEGLLLGDQPQGLSPEAEHLEDDPGVEMFGSTDVQHVIESGGTWIPPESPTPEGLRGTDAGVDEMGEDH